MDFRQNSHRRKKTKSKNEFVGVKYRTNPSPILPQPLILGEEILKIHADINSNPTLR